ncbi:uncharacterized protein LOC114355959 [Ostrinia furnacalis]|uniref:uncharacterized protein LOC114355959 n=1 Tax=Ostrinia furnacalis TaxID=93504 RepID=UPI00103AF306|nr:uncharacterized protein LOC114355959 [Ostrinia furnacalis]
MFTRKLHMYQIVIIVIVNIVIVNDVLCIEFIQLGDSGGFEESPVGKQYESIYQKDEPEFLIEDKVPIIREGFNYDSKEDDDIKTLLEEKYKFKNDEMSTRYRISNDEGGYPDDRNIAWAFRSYAVRRIVGGMETSISMYPYNVAISRNGKHWCGGSIIDEQWVLTAGHCLESAYDGDKKKLQPFIVRAGSSFHNRGGYQARVNKVFFPKHYSPGSADFDYSLLRLDRPMPIGRNIAVLNLPSKDYVVKEEDILIVTGWGSTDESGFGHIPDRLRFVPVPVMVIDDCQKSYRFYITPRMMCAGYATGGKDACNHDSGGPAVRDGVLLGIVSFGGKQCGDPRSPGVYSRVSEVTDWVEETITKNEAQNVPELQAKIKKARMRERELQKFKARVEDKKNKIKSWLRDTLKSPTFIKLAKKKLKEAGYQTRRFHVVETNASALDDQAMDEINLSNLIHERIIEGDDGNEAEKLLRTLALQEVMLNNNSEEIFYKDMESESMETFSLCVYCQHDKNGEVERQNRDILKRLKISQVEKKNWKEALLEYMAMYNSTPHTVTGKTPAELFFRRQFRDKLPMIQDMTHSSADLEMRDRDKELKEKGKEYADMKRRATGCELEVGDKVYVKNMTKQNKLSLNYEPETHTVEENKGGDVSLRNDETGQRIRRNVVHLKRVEGQWKVLDEENNASDAQTNDSGDVNQSQLGWIN